GSFLSPSRAHENAKRDLFWKRYPRTHEIHENNETAAGSGLLALTARPCDDRRSESTRAPDEVNGRPAPCLVGSGPEEGQDALRDGIPGAGRRPVQADHGDDDAELEHDHPLAL